MEYNICYHGTSDFFLPQCMLKQFIDIAVFRDNLETENIILKFLYDIFIICSNKNKVFQQINIKFYVQLIRNYTLLRWFCLLNLRFAVSATNYDWFTRTPSSVLVTETAILLCKKHSYYIPHRKFFVWYWLSLWNNIPAWLVVENLEMRLVILFVPEQRFP